MQIGPENDGRTELELFHCGENYHAYRFMGAHKLNINGTDGLMFRTWAPNAKSVSVVGMFNNWDHTRNWMHRISDSNTLVRTRGAVYPSRPSDSSMTYE